MSLILCGDGGERQDFPVFLCHYVADQIVLVKPLHYNDDDAILLAVEPAKKCAVIPIVDTECAGFLKRPLRASGDRQE